MYSFDKDCEGLAYFIFYSLICELKLKDLGLCSVAKRAISKRTGRFSVFVIIRTNTSVCKIT